MPFSTEDKVIKKHYRLDKYEVKRLLKEFPNKGWTKGGLRHLLRKLTKLETLHGFRVVIRRVIRGKRLLRFLTVANVNKTLFTETLKYI